MRTGIIASQGGVREALDLARDAEAHGWDGFFTWDGISVGPTQPAFDPFSLLAAVAQCTRTLSLGAMVFAPARRRPLTFAQQVLTVDHLSGGRLVVPVGLGAADEAGFARVSGEADSARVRASMLDESLAILDLAATGEPFSYSGEHNRLRRLAGAGAAPAATGARLDGRRLAVGAVDATRRALGRGGAPAAPVSAGALRGAGRRGGRLGGRGTRAAPRGRFRTGTRFDVVVSGRLPDDPSDAAARIQELESAGATWWVEAWWEPTDTAAALLDRVRRGPLPR